MTAENKSMLQMLVCAGLWSIAGIFIKLIDCNAMVIAGVRSLFAAIAVFVFIKVTGKKIIISKRTVLCAVFLCITFILFVLANKNTTAANAIVLQFTAPVFVMVIESVAFRKKPKFFDAVAVAVTLAGISLFFVDGLENGHITGNLFAVAAGLFLSLMYVTVEKSQGDEKISGIFFGQLLTAVAGIPFMFFTENSFTVLSILFLFILGVFQLGIPYILLALASEHCPALACSLISAAEPLLNPVWVAVFYGEIPSLLSLLGGIIVIAAVTIWCIFKE